MNNKIKSKFFDLLFKESGEAVLKFKDDKTIVFKDIYQLIEFSDCLQGVVKNF